MDCDISGEQLWSWIDRDAPELEEHLSGCSICRARAGKIREEIGILASDAAMEIPIPEMVGPYTIVRLLGEGGQALVYEAEQPSPRRRVALKVLKGGYLVDKTRVRHFRRETQTLARLNHRAIATIFEAGRTQDGLHYFAMELVEGLPLDAFVRDRKPDRQELLQLFVELCKAIQHAHEHGVVHRDLKPSNIMVEAGGEPKILDFGLARLTRSDLMTSITATKDGRVEGTPRYMSPEQALGELKSVDARSDIYTLGVILYEMLTGQPPTDVSSITPESIRTIREEIPRRPSVVNPALHGDLDAIILKALEKEPERRYQSVADLADDISRYLAGEPIVASRPSMLYVLRKKWFRRWAWAALGLGAAIALVFGTSRIRQKPDDPFRGPMAVLHIHADLYRDGPTDLIYYRAEKAPSSYPQLPEAILVQARAAYLRREHNHAISVLTNQIEQDPSPWPYQILLAEIQRQQNPQIQDSPKNRHWNTELAASADAWYLRSFATLDILNALECSKSALVLDPGHPLALASAAHLYEITGNPDSALTMAGRLIELGDRKSFWLRFRATLLTKLGRYQEALDVCDEWTTALPDHYYGYYMRAKLERRTRQYQDAERDFSLAIDKHGRHDAVSAWHYYHRGTVRWLLGREEDAITDYSKAYEFLNHATFANARLFILLKDTGRAQDADAMLAEARDNGDPDRWLEKIFDCLDGRLPPEGLAAFAATAGDSVRLCEAYYYAGEAALLAGSADDAREWFQKCIDTGVKYDPGNILDPMSEHELASMRLSSFGEKIDPPAAPADM